MKWSAVAIVNGQTKAEATPTITETRKLQAPRPLLHSHHSLFSFWREKGGRRRPGLWQSLESLVREWSDRTSRQSQCPHLFMAPDTERAPWSQAMVPTLKSSTQWKEKLMRAKAIKAQTWSLICTNPTPLSTPAGPKEVLLPSQWRSKYSCPLRWWRRERPLTLTPAAATSACLNSWVAQSFCSVTKVFSVCDKVFKTHSKKGDEEQLHLHCFWVSYTMQASQHGF